MKKLLIALLFLIIVLSLSGFFFRDKIHKYIVAYSVDDFQSCVDGGFAVAESYPRQCFLPNGESFTEIIPTPDPNVSPTPSIVPSPFPTHQSISITSPKPGSIISQRVTIVGKAKGSWFNEGRFPVFVLDEEDKEVGSGSAIAQVDIFSSEEYIPFAATISLDPDKSSPGSIKFVQDSPSGLTGNEFTYQIPVFIEFQESE